MGDNCRGAAIEDEQVIRRFDNPLKQNAGFSVLARNLFDSAGDEAERHQPGIPRALPVQPKDPDAFEGPVVVFDGPEDYHHRIDDPANGITEHTLLIMRGGADRLSRRRRKWSTCAPRRSC